MHVARAAPAKDRIQGEVVTRSTSPAAPLEVEPPSTGERIDSIVATPVVVDRCFAVTADPDEAIELAKELSTRADGAPVAVLVPRQMFRRADQPTTYAVVTARLGVPARGTAASATASAVALQSARRWRVSEIAFGDVTMLAPEQPRFSPWLFLLRQR